MGITDAASPVHMPEVLGAVGAGLWARRQEGSRSEFIGGRYLPRLQVLPLVLECFHLRSLRGYSRPWETPCSPCKTSLFLELVLLTEVLL